MKITWYGQASFGIVGRSGIRIVTDPYDPEKSGFKVFPDPADVIIKSSSNDDFHDNDHLVPKREGCEVIDALPVALNGGRTESHGIAFSAIEAMENLDHPYREPDQNAMYRFRVDDIEIGHMGDMGNRFSDAQIDFFRGVSILFGHAGGYPVIPLEELRRVVDEVRPQIVIPMHFRTLCYKPRDMHFINEFLVHFPEETVDFACTSSVDIETSRLPAHTRGLVLDYL